MSLNWREIDCILKEISLKNSFIRQIHQPIHQTLIFEIYNQRNSFKLFFSFSNPNCRLHLLNHRFENPPRPPRFVSFLRSRTRNGRVIQVYQVGRERIIKLEIVKGDKQTILWARLWAGAANMIATDREGRILDALYRRPRRQEITGGFFNPEQNFKHPVPEPPSKDQYTIRELPGEGSFNEKIERFFFQLEQQKERERLKASLTRQLSVRENRIQANIENLKLKLEGYANFDQLKIFGDLILSSLHTIHKGDRWLVTEDFLNPERTIEIELDLKATPAENAERYYEKFRKARIGLKKLKEEITEQEKHLRNIRKKLKQISTEEDPEKLKGELSLPGRETGTSLKEKLQAPGLIFISSPFRILLGRTARENDMLLRKFVKGNDTWFHARDYPGAYVFIKSIPGKSIPLKVMLDAGNLALFYSKGKNSGQGNVYYTRVKYLRRVKDGKPGKVIPTQEKNLFIKLDQKRIEQLRSSP